MEFPPTGRAFFAAQRRLLNARARRRNRQECPFCHEDESGSFFDDMDLHVLFECKIAPLFRVDRRLCYVCQKLFANATLRKEHESGLCLLIDYGMVNRTLVERRQQLRAAGIYTSSDSEGPSDDSGMSSDDSSD